MRGLLITLVVLAGFTSGCAEPGENRPFTPGGVSAESPSSASPTPAAGAPRTETLSAGPNLKVTVEWPAGLDPEHAEMLTAYRDVYVGKLRSVTSGGRQAPYRQGVELEILGETGEWVQKFLDQRRSVRGNARIYSMRVNAVEGAGAEVAVCVDETRLRLTEAATGRVLADQPPWYKRPRGIYYHAAALHRGDDDLWRIRLFRYALQPDERAKGCLR